MCLCPQGFTGQRCEVNLCSAIVCPANDGSQQCRVRNGRASCECVDGPLGESCRQQSQQRVINHISGVVSGAPAVILCQHECRNGGQCVLAAGNPGVLQPGATMKPDGVNGECRCKAGFLGANCNVWDPCVE